MIQLTQEKPGKLLAWETVEGASIQHTGTVEFHQLSGEVGTEVSLTLQHNLPVHFSETELSNSASTALARFKEFAETDPEELIR